MNLSRAPSGLAATPSPGSLPTNCPAHLSTTPPSTPSRTPSRTPLCLALALTPWVLSLSACGGVGGLDPQIERSLARAAVDAGRAAELASFTTTVSSRAIALERASALALAEAEAALRAGALRDAAVALDPAQDRPQVAGPDAGLDATRMGLFPSAPGAGTSSEAAPAMAGGATVTARADLPAPLSRAGVAPAELAAAPGSVGRMPVNGKRGVAQGDAQDQMVFITTPLPDEAAAPVSIRPAPAVSPVATSRGPALAAVSPAATPLATMALASSAAPPAPLADCGLGQGVSEILGRINSLRARGARCGSKGSFEAAPALGWNGLLQAAAAGHALDMAVNNYFAHESPQGQTLAARATEAQYRYLVIAENIAAGQPTLDAVLATWMASDTHCANLMHPGVRELALVCDRAEGARYATYWTLNLGASL